MDNSWDHKSLWDKQVSYDPTIWNTLQHCSIVSPWLQLAQTWSVRFHVWASSGITTLCANDTEMYMLWGCVYASHYLAQLLMLADKAWSTYQATSTTCLQGPFYWHGLISIPAWMVDNIINCGTPLIIHSQTSWISNFIPHFTRHGIIYPCWE